MPHPRDDSYAEGLKALRNADFLASPKYKEQQGRADRKGAHYDILEFERSFIRRMARLGVPMYCSELRRSKADQDAAYARGVSNAKGGQSAHNFACAVDIIHSVKGWKLTKTEWALIGHIGKEVASGLGVRLVWGGDWKNPWDPAHWEIAGWRTLPHAAYGS